MRRAMAIACLLLVPPILATEAGADPLDAAVPWRAHVVGPGVTPPAVTASTPPLGMFDPQVDLGHPEFAGAAVRSLSATAAVSELGPTASASLAAAPVNGVGITGVWPGMPVVVAPPADLRCASVAEAVTRAVAEGASVLMTGYGSSSWCQTLHEAILRAQAADVLVVGPGPIVDSDGRPTGPSFPASHPHVLTAAASGPQDAARFASADPSTDLAAPGAGLIAAVPAAFDDDGTPDGYRRVSGSAYSAAIVAAAATWVRAARPRLSATQTAELLRRTSRDLGAPGYDELTGWGVVQVGPALTAPAPPEDPREPNDAVSHVDGTLLDAPARAIWSGRRDRVLTATLDRHEDPADVYRLRVPARRRAVVRVEPSAGDPDLTVLRRRKSGEPRRVGRSRSAGSGGERVALRFASRRVQEAYVVVEVAASAPERAAAYTLEVR